jgi:SAM-dependent methyltransferase
MADRWFEIAALDHFWIKRRFDVFQRLCGELIPNAREIAEIGCGHGLLQRQIEDKYEREVKGFDLNEIALKQSLATRSDVCCYDICQMNPAFKGKFDVIFLFDVLEHIDNEDRFLQAVLFHLAPAGKLVINVPSGQWIYSAYDRAAGHQRRYAIDTLVKSVSRSNLRVATWSYWGFPLLPALILRKIMLWGKTNQDKIISEGFDSRSHFINQLLSCAAGCEPIPQKLIGTSLMAVVERS